MATVWTVPIDITPRWLASPEVQTFLASNDLADASPDPRVRLAQFAEVTTSLGRHVGRTFTSVQSASAALFDRTDGGGHGVPVALRLAALRLIVTAVHQTRPAPKPLPARVAEQLGRYVYALLDPRNRSVFYVGSGRGNRVFGHVWAALEENESLRLLERQEKDSSESTAATIGRIRDVYDSGHEVEHFIVAHRITSADDDRVADEIGRALVGVLGLIEPDTEFPGVTNPSDGPLETTAATVDDLVLQYAAEPVPDLPTPCFLVEVKGAAKRGTTPDEIYAMSRQSWAAGNAVRDSAKIPVIVFADNIVRAVYRAESWAMVPRSTDTTLWRFTGTADPELEAQYVNKRVTPDRVGLKKWPGSGSVSHLTHARPGR
ncbi:GIY-YIG nuclease family protein [Rhodococcus oryzae]|uniref:GIY-YIG nuclease family protein n=1 Tax=Rhodococcus oryzae TaxID=2571143 RepID=A0ABY2RP24_9NOCA|nr:GIY-YIG nuclease family protein [Rhodococcus oryzae]TJZ80222.1 GIY-YIG nuclease family protein [Rhodococcus oryzae]